MRRLETTLDVPIDEAESSARGASALGLPAITEIVATFQAQFGVERAPLKPLCACNQEVAHQVLQIDPSGRARVSSNVVLEAVDTRARAAVVEPRALMTDPTFEPNATQAKDQITVALGGVLSASTS